MTNFGFSAFLKLIHLNERPRRTELRNRIRGGSGSGYDYHRSLRGLAKKHIVDDRDVASLYGEAETISNLAERNSAKSGLAVLQNWRVNNPGRVLAAERVTIDSPLGAYKVTCSPDFGIDTGGVKLAVHIWNTKKPNLDRRLVAAALTPFFDPVGKQGFDEIAVLSLQTGQLYRLADTKPHLALAAVVFEHVDNLIEELNDVPRRPPAEDRAIL